MASAWRRLVMASCAVGALLAASPALAHPLEIVPSDDRIYQDRARLTALGLTPMWETTARPLTRLEIARLVARALDRLAGRPRMAPADLEPLERLVLTFSDELPLAGYQVVEPPRSEEHTSELQSQFHLVCRLLLEKKKRTLEKTSFDDRLKTRMNMPM